MNEFKGTKTKWNKMDASRFGIPFIIYNEKEETIFQCYGEDAKANALLISKSPEMLEMLQEIITDWEVGNEDNFIMANNIDKAKQLIKEATQL
jgi:hypothetical protein